MAVKPPAKLFKPAPAAAPKAAPAPKAPAPAPKPSPAAVAPKQTATKPTVSLPSIPQLIKAPAAVAKTQVANKVLPMPTPSPSAGPKPTVKAPEKSKGLFSGITNAVKKTAGFVGNELLGLDDFGNVIKHAKNGDWGKAAKSLGAGAFEMGTTALMFVPGVGTAAGAAIKTAATAGKVGAKQVVKNAVAKPIGQKVASQATQAATKVKSGLQTAQTVVKKAAVSGATKATQASKAAVQVGKKTVGAVKTQTAKIATKVVDNIPGIGKAASKLKAPLRTAGAAIKGGISKIGKLGKNKIVNPIKSKVSQLAKKAKTLAKGLPKVFKGKKKLKTKTKIKVGAGLAKIPGIIGGIDGGDDGEGDGGDGPGGDGPGGDGPGGDGPGDGDPDPNPRGEKPEAPGTGEKDDEVEKPNMDSTQTLDLISQDIDNIGQDVLDAFLGNIIESIELDGNNLLTSVTLLQVDGLVVSSTIGSKNSSYNLPKASGSIFANQLPDSGYKLYTPIFSQAQFATKAKFGTSSPTGFVDNKVKTDVSGMPKYDLKLDLPTQRGIATYEVQYIMENIT